MTTEYTSKYKFDMDIYTSFIEQPIRTFFQSVKNGKHQQDQRQPTPLSSRLLAIVASPQFPFVIRTWILGIVFWQVESLVRNAQSLNRRSRRLSPWHKTVGFGLNDPSQEPWPEETADGIVCICKTQLIKQGYNCKGFYNRAQVSTENHHYPQFHLFGLWSSHAEV